MNTKGFGPGLIGHASAEHHKPWLPRRDIIVGQASRLPPSAKPTKGSRWRVRWAGETPALRWLLLLGVCGTIQVQAACLPAPSGLVGHWTGEGNANDLVGGNNGTLMNGATANATGVVGRAFSFDGINDFVQIADAPALKPTNLTIEAWVWLDAFGSAFNSIGGQYIVFKKNTRGGFFEGYSLQEQTNAVGHHVFHWVVIGSNGPPTAKVDTTTLLSTGVWYHVAGVRGSNYLQIYLNGALEAQTSVTYQQDYGADPLYFGTTAQGFDGKFKGRLDEVSLYNRALSSSEIAGIYAAGAAGKCPASTAAQLVYKQLLVIPPFDFLRPDRGVTPRANLIQSTDGTLYGAMAGGNSTSFRINRDGSGSGYAPDDINLFARDIGDAALLQGRDGAFYGTKQSSFSSANGEVFRLQPDVFGNLSGGEAFTTLRSFAGPSGDGQFPRAALVQGVDGLLYGTTAAGGSSGLGIVFKIATNGSGYAVLKNFTGGDGANPNAALIQGRDGALYGTTTNGGTGGRGAVFRMTTNGTGYTVLKNFTGGDGSGPWAALLQGSDGALYGTTLAGGSANLGTVFKVNTNGGGFIVLKDFTRTDGANPCGSLVEWLDGGLVGTTVNGGSSNLGTVFRLNKDGSGYFVLKHFAGLASGDGANPYAGLLQGDDGGLYGTTFAGGIANEEMPAGWGTVFTLGLRPVNDNFANRISLTGPAAAGRGFNLNATAEPNEPPHGVPGNFATNSIWWSWSGLPTGLVTLFADGEANYLIEVYTGNALTSLSLVASNTGPQYLGDRNRVSFTATAGTTYQVAIFGVSSLTNQGAGPVNLSLGTLSTKILTLNSSLDPNTNTLFNALVQIGNADSIPTGPLRLTLLAQPGFSVQQDQYTSPFAGAPALPSDQVLATYYLTNPPVAPHGTTNLPVSGVAPAPTPTDPVLSKLGFGWGVFLVLEQQVGTNWFTRDRNFLLYGQWPVIGGFAGPGGGVVRINPGQAVTGKDVTLTVNLLPAEAVAAGAGWRLRGQTAGYFSVGHFEILKAGTTNVIEFKPVTDWILPGDQVIQLQRAQLDLVVAAQYSVVAPRLSINRSDLRITGATGTTYRIEFQTNLTGNAWVPWRTNKIVTNPAVIPSPIVPGAPRRFYRALWLP